MKKSQKSHHGQWASYFKYQASTMNKSIKTPHIETIFSLTTQMPYIVSYSKKLK